MRATRLAYVIFLDLITRVMFVRGTDHEDVWNFFSHFLTPSNLGQNTILDILFSNALSLRSPLKLRDQLAHPYKITGSVIVMYLNLYILTQQWQDERLEAGIP